MEDPFPYTISTSNSYRYHRPKEISSFIEFGAQGNIAMEDRNDDHRPIEDSSAHHQQGGSLDKRLESSQDTAITATDVLCGKGKLQYHNPGNKIFRNAVSKSLPDYLKAKSRLEKSRVVNEIIHGVKMSGGRFLKRNQITESWCDLTDRQVAEKVAHSLRDSVQKDLKRKTKTSTTKRKELPDKAQLKKAPASHGESTNSPLRIPRLPAAAEALVTATMSTYTEPVPAPPAAVRHVSSPTESFGQIRPMASMSTHAEPVPAPSAAVRHETLSTDSFGQIRPLAATGTHTDPVPAPPAAARHVSLPSFGQPAPPAAVRHVSLPSFGQRRSMGNPASSMSIGPIDASAVAAATTTSSTFGYPAEASLRADIHLPPGGQQPDPDLNECGGDSTNNDHQFLEKIDAALGPQHPDIEHPMERLFEEGR